MLRARIPRKMHSIFGLLIFLALLSLSLAAIIDQRPIGEDQVKRSQDKIHILCSPCKKFFETIKKDLPEVGEITKDVLEDAVNVSLF
jgi:hypothetical protein